MTGKYYIIHKKAKGLSLATLLFLAVITHSLYAIEVGKFAYKGALEDFSGDTITVSDTMIALSNKIFAKTDFSVGRDTIVDTPSIMFLIDNSSSMDAANKDINGNRFTVTKNFIDSIRAKFPSAEIGLAVFGATLWFDPGDHPYSINFTSCAAQSSGAYLQLLKLDSTYASMGNQTGLTLLKNILTTRDSGAITRLNYTPSNSSLTTRNTNINAGFDAVRCAMAASKHPKANQYVIFLSDGEANRPSETTKNNFTAATNVPTTFTVFFTNVGGVPSTLANFTTNVRSNNYSTKNDSSRAWAYNNQSASQLMSFLMTNIFGVINTSMPGNPAQLTIGSQTSTNWSVVDSAFLFPYLFPLTGIVTPFTATIRYKFANGDTSHSFNFFVKREPLYRITPPAMYELKYWDRNLNLRYNNADVATITETMDSLELVFDYKPGTALYDYSNIKVQVFNQQGAIRDNETFTLNKAGTVFSIKFKKGVSASPIPGNKVFEVQGITGDSLIAIFRNSENPLLPLDTLRIAIPLNLSPMPSLTSAITRDLDGDGFIDHIQIVFDTSVTLTNSMKNSFTIKGNGTLFPVDSITKINDSTFMLNLREVTTSLPQTSWTPDLSLTLVQNIQPVVNFRTTDGCPPVVWEAKKFLSGSSPTNDTLKIFMSEKITGANGSPFNLQTSPSEVFNTWSTGTSSSLVLDNMFAGITSFSRIDQDSILVVVMSNSKDISTNNYINIRNENSLIKDNAGNLPTAVNQKVRVTIGGVVFSIFTGPNPARPALSHPEPLNFVHEPNALTWVKQGQGTVIQLRNLNRPLNPDHQRNVHGVIKIIDIVGNTVTWSDTKDIFTQLDASKGSTQGMNIYWNGLNEQGMVVAPGVYRVVVYINYPAGSNVSNSKVVSKVGISR